ncbi:MAG: TMEM175 family protein [Bacteroidota bacterium]
MNTKFLVSTNERLSALFDGVIAIAITLLVLELKLPEVQGNGAELLLHDALRAQIPEIVAWLISFIMIARIWQEQHIIWVYISGCDRWSIILTFCLLAACSLIPFGSHLLGKYPDTPFVVLIFSVLMVVNGLLVAALAAYVIRNDHLHREPGQVIILKTRVIYMMTVIPTVGAFAVFLAYKQHPLVGVSGWLIEPLALFVYHQVKANAKT